MSISLKNRFAGCLIGQCLGDALGFMVEGYPPHACKHYVDNIMNSDRIFDQKRSVFSFGQYSDDSQLAREFLQSYAACGKFNPSDYGDRIAAIFNEHRIVGYGSATKQAAWRLINGVSWENSGTLPPAAGNGSAMRAGPVGMLYFDEPQQMIQIAHDQGRITHQDRRCSAGAVTIAGAVALVIREENFSISKFLTQLSKWARPFDDIIADALINMQEWVHLPPHEALSHIAKVGLAPNFSDRWQGISPFVTGSVLWSIYAFLKFTDSYWKAISTAIAVGGDVDTTAAMTGAISGARVGLEGIPLSFAKHINDNGTWKFDDLVALANQCYAIKYSTQKTNESWKIY